MLQFKLRRIRSNIMYASWGEGPAATFFVENENSSILHPLLPSVTDKTNRAGDTGVQCIQTFNFISYANGALTGTQL